MTEVVAAVQSPGLFDILTTATAWSLKMCDLGDVAGMTEMASLRSPVVSPSSVKPSVVIVCTPAHLSRAQDKWPSAKIVWAIHNGRERWLLPQSLEHHVSAVVCFSERVRWLASAGKTLPHFFVSPAYEPRPRWSWRANMFWTLRNRPNGRLDDRDNVIPAVMRGLAHTFYGQRQPAGPADTERKEQLIASCSAYVSCLDRAAGFGLAEHEAMAAGVPVIGAPWGDMDAEAYDYPFAYDLRDLHLRATHVATNRETAEQMSRLGLEYISRHRSFDRMNQTIASLMKSLG